MEDLYQQYMNSRELTTQHQRLAEIIEMIHTASLIHDDVIDDSGLRRGVYLRGILYCIFCSSNFHFSVG